jgi:hypothetical protein
MTQSIQDESETVRCIQAKQDKAAFLPISSRLTSGPMHDGIGEDIRNAPALPFPPHPVSISSTSYRLEVSAP